MPYNTTGITVPDIKKMKEKLGNIYSKMIFI